MSRKRTNFDQSARDNNDQYGQYLDRLIELSLSMFEWKNLPDTIDQRFLELTLFREGKAIFFEDEELGHLALQFSSKGPMDIYRIPTGRRAYAVNGYQRNLDKSNSVIIWNNYLHTNSILPAKNYARRLYDLDRTIDVNARAQKTPVLVQGTEQQRLVLLNLYKEYDGNAPVIFGDKNLDINALKSIQTNAPYVSDKLYELKTEIWNEALTWLGISNVNIQKKERLITDEVSRNSGGVVASRYSRLESRRQACEQINDMFGLNIECNYREDFQNTDEDIDFGTDTLEVVGKRGDNKDE